MYLQAPEAAGVRERRRAGSRPAGSRPVTPVLAGLALAILAIFVVDRLGLIGSRGLLMQPAMVLCVGVAVWALAVGGQLRTQLCLTALIALVVALPINRVPGVTTLSLLIFLVAVGALTAVGVHGASRASMEGKVMVGLFLGLMVLSTVLAGSTSGIIKLALSVVPAAGAFLLTSRLDFAARRQVSIVVVVLACALSVLAIAEPVVFPQHLYPAVVDAATQLPDSTQGDNTLLGGLRSQVTFGHPLPFGFFVVIALGLLLRVVRPPALVRWPIIMLFGVAMVFAGSRNSLLLAVLLVLLFGAARLTAVRLLWGGLLGSIAVVLALLTERIPVEFFDEFLGSGSYTHRLAVVDAFGQLLTRQSFRDVVLGNGAGSLPSLYAQGLLQTDGFNVVDNQFVSALAQGGLIAMVALAALLIRPLFARDPYWRAAVLVVLTNCMIYDWFGWPSSATVAFFVLGCAYSGGPDHLRRNRVPMAGDAAERRVRGTVLGRATVLAGAGGAPGSGASGGTRRTRLGLRPPR